jgi:hypothetical protein
MFESMFKIDFREYKKTFLTQRLKFKDTLIKGK